MSKKAKEINENWKSFDIKNAVIQDIGAAVSLLCMLRDNPDLLNIVCTEIEIWRKKMIENEKAKSNGVKAEV